MCVFWGYRKNFVGTRKQVRISHGKRAIGVRATEVRLYLELGSQHMCWAHKLCHISFVGCYWLNVGLGRGLHLNVRHVRMEEKKNALWRNLPFIAWFGRTTETRKYPNNKKSKNKVGQPSVNEHLYCACAKLGTILFTWVVLSSKMFPTWFLRLLTITIKRNASLIQNGGKPLFLLLFIVKKKNNKNNKKNNKKKQTKKRGIGSLRFGSVCIW